MIPRCIEDLFDSIKYHSTIYKARIIKKITGEVKIIEIMTIYKLGKYVILSVSEKATSIKVKHRRMFRALFY